MSKYDESDSDDFNKPEETDSVIRELQTKIVRLEAQLDQLTASVHEQSEESAVLLARLALLEEVVARLHTRQWRDTRLLILAWVMVAVSLAMSVFTYFTM